MKERISALMDGELERHEAAGAIGSLHEEGEARQGWRAYHVIGDAMRDTRMLSAGFSSRVIARLEAEPTVLAPMRARLASPAAMRWSALAAGLAAVAFVGWIAFQPQEEARQAQQAEVVLPTPPAVQEAALVAPPDAADDYVLAHQGSARNSLLGAAPYVRVSGETASRRR